MPKPLSTLSRPHRMSISFDELLIRDLERIAQSWRVPVSTVVYWMIKGLIADSRGEKFAIAGDEDSERLARWLMRKFPPLNPCPLKHLHPRYPAGKEPRSMHDPKTKPRRPPRFDRRSTRPVAEPTEPT